MCSSATLIPLMLSTTPRDGEFRLPSRTFTGRHLGLIDTTVNFNINNDNAASPNTGTGLPRQLQFMVRVKF